MMLRIVIKTFNFAIKSTKIESYYQNKAITKKEKEKKKSSMTIINHTFLTMTLTIGLVQTQAIRPLPLKLCFIFILQQLCANTTSFTKIFLYKKPIQIQHIFTSHTFLDTNTIQHLQSIGIITHKRYYIILQKIFLYIYIYF